MFRAPPGIARREREIEREREREGPASAQKKKKKQKNKEKTKKHCEAPERLKDKPEMKKKKTGGASSAQYHELKLMIRGLLAGQRYETGVGRKQSEQK